MANARKTPRSTRRVVEAQAPIPLAVAASQDKPLPGLFVKHDQVARAKTSRRKRPGDQTLDMNKWNPFTYPTHPKGVLPDGEKGMAADSSLEDVFGWASLAQSAFVEGLTFMGFTELAILLQRPEFRVISQTIAEEMTREWIEFDATSGKTKQDKQERINALEDAIKEFKLKDACELAAFQDGGFGRSHIFVDCCDVDDRDELVTSIGNGQDYISLAKWSKGSQNKPKDSKVKGAKLKAFRNVEPVWCYPNKYNSIDPLKGTWYKPETWFVMGKEVHHTRLLTFIGRPVPDILKPAYSFGGLSMTQQAKPYVDNWLRTRQSVADLVRSFVVQGLKTNLAALNQAGGDAVINRMEMFNAYRDNHDSFLLDKDTEEWFNVTTSLASLDALQAQSQEQMSSVSRIPLVKLLGISPHGLNATAEPEIRVFYDTIKSMQEKFFRDHLTTCIHFIMLHLWGEIDDEITFHFRDLWQLDETARLANEKVKTDIDDANVAMGAVSAEEVRDRVAKDPDSIYANIDLTGPAPEPPMPAEPGGEFGGENDNEEQPGGRAKDPSSPLANSISNRAAKSLGGFPGDNGAPDFAKSDVAFEHPAKGKDSCLECEHFRDGNDSCELVRGLIRPEDWCELFEPEVGLGHWFFVAPLDEDDEGGEDAEFREDDHPRDDDGKFATGAGGGGSGGGLSPTRHKTKVKNSIAKVLAAHGYKKSKTLTKEGHHVFEHPGGHKVYVGASRPDQEFVAGYKLGGSEKYGAGAGSLLKHLNGIHGEAGQQPERKPRVKSEPEAKPEKTTAERAEEGRRSFYKTTQSLGNDVILRNRIESSSHQNARDTMREQGKDPSTDNPEYWEVANTTAKMMLDAPRDFFPDLYDEDGKRLDESAIARRSRENQREADRLRLHGQVENILRETGTTREDRIMAKMAHRGLNEEQSKRVADKVAEYMGYDKTSNIVVSNEHKTFELDGKQVTYGGSYTPSSRKVTIYNTKQMDPDSVSGIFAHEIMHAKYQDVSDTYYQEVNRLQMSRTDKRKAGAAFNTTGVLPESLREKYPVVAALRPLLRNIENLRADDGITDYSRAWWKEAEVKQYKEPLAINETLAEMARLDWEGSLPRLLWYKESKTWKPLYEAMNDLYKSDRVVKT